MLQRENEITTAKCHTGVLSKDEKGYQFVEAVRKKRSAGNPKLLDGKFVTMIRLQNGEFRFYLKQIDTKTANAYELANAIASEIISGFNIIKS